MRPKYSSPGADAFIISRTCCCHLESFGAAAFLLLAGELVFFGAAATCDGAVAAETEPANPNAVAAAAMDMNARFNNNPFLGGNQPFALGTFFTPERFGYSLT